LTTSARENSRALLFARQEILPFAELSLRLRHAADRDGMREWNEWNKKKSPGAAPGLLP
jgi:hypothetical protein